MLFDTDIPRVTFLLLAQMNRELNEFHVLVSEVANLGEVVEDASHLVALADGAKLVVEKSKKVLLASRVALNLLIAEKDRRVNLNVDVSSRLVDRSVLYIFHDMHLIFASLSGIDTF